MPHETEVVYTIHVHDEGPDGLWAEVEQLPGCFASGDTREELEEALLEAMGLYLSSPGRRAVVRFVDGAGNDLEHKRVLVTA